MKAHNLIASAAAVLLTVASLSVVNYNVDSQPAAAAQQGAARVTNLAPVQVRPSAAEMRSAALLPGNDTAAIGTMSVLGNLGESGTSGQFSLLGSQLAMPYYSFGNKFGRISKE
ncbi:MULTISPECIES: hypothetical protein [Rhodanobacter]|uniref:Uncharacterized protein n=2 Tax=Rhodanobacter TaxID=75309 RepID=I4VW81_9GAMM|nr:hypothetical protein [Rhodanobacter spathiphylli]EIL91472.1 hypothetical protein UU7_13238 [Rhodanobacter spathiphylli B39]